MNARVGSVGAPFGFDGLCRLPYLRLQCSNTFEDFSGSYR